MTSGQFDHYAVTKATMCCLYFLLGNQILLLVSMLSPSSVTMLSPRRHMPLCWSRDPSRHVGILQVVAASKWDWEAGDPENLKRHGWHCQIMNKSRWRHSQVTGVALQTWSNCNQEGLGLPRLHEQNRGRDRSAIYYGWKKTKTTKNYLALRLLMKW